MHKSTSIISPCKLGEMLEHHHLGIHVMIVLSPTLNQKMLSSMNILCIYLFTFAARGNFGGGGRGGPASRTWNSIIHLVSQNLELDQKNIGNKRRTWWSLRRLFKSESIMLASIWGNAWLRRIFKLNANTINMSYSLLEPEDMSCCVWSSKDITRGLREIPANWLDSIVFACSCSGCIHNDQV